METPYGAEWSVEEKVKRREMVAPEAQYLFIREAPATCDDEDSLKCEKKSSHLLWTGYGDPVVGFVHYRFTIEEDIPVIYVYELQLESHVRGKGLGKFLMQLIELIARKVLDIFILNYGNFIIYYDINSLQFQIYIPVVISLLLCVSFG